MKRTAQKLLALALTLSLLLAAAPAAAADGEVAEIALSATALTLTSGTTGTLTVMITYDDDDETTVYDPSLLNWGSSNGSVARVTVSGGAVTITALNAGTATITASAKDRSGQEASCTVTVRALALTPSLSGGRLDFGGLMGGGYTTISGSRFAYVSGISVPTAQGTLYDGYVSEAEPGEGVSSAQRYYPGASGTRLFKNITFVPRPGYTGTAEIGFTCYYADGMPYTASISVTVNAASSSLSYTSVDGAPVQFVAEEFAAYAQNLGYNSLRAVRFTLPSAGSGTLWYNYTDADINEGKLTADTLYYRSGTPALDRVWLVPRGGYTGSFSVSFTGYDNTGASFAGSVNITVTGISSGASAANGDLSYSVAAGSRLSFSAADFNAACESVLGTALNYIYFRSVPGSASGALYDGSGTVSVGSSNRYYYSASGSRRLIGEVYFAASASAGTRTITYTGVDAAGTAYSGTVRIVVTSGEGAALYYSVTAGQRVYLDSADFSAACYAVTGAQLSRITFSSLPPSGRGTLYRDANTAVSTGVSYYRAGASPLIDELSFLPSASFTSGSVVISYIGYSVSGPSFTGSVTFAAGASSSSSSGTGASEVVNTGGSGMISYASNGLPVSFRPADFTADAAKRLSYGLTSLKFYTPDASAGRLCVDFNSPTSYTSLSGTTEFSPSSVSRISFLPHGGFSGAAYVRFVGTDATGKSYTGSLAVNVTPPTASSYFYDMGGHAWAVPSVDFLHRYGVVQGTDYVGSYSPANPMRRGDFVLMLSRAFGLSGYGAASFDDVPPDSYYASAIAAAGGLGIIDGEAGTGEDGGALWLFRPDEAVTRQDAALWLYRAMRRSGTLNDGTAADLAAFADASDIAGYARTALATLARLGVFQGDGGYLYPAATLTRAEMAKILYYAIT